MAAIGGFSELCCNGEWLALQKGRIIHSNGAFSSLYNTRDSATESMMDGLPANPGVSPFRMKAVGKDGLAVDNDREDMDNFSVGDSLP